MSSGPFERENPAPPKGDGPFVAWINRELEDENSFWTWAFSLLFLALAIGASILIIVGAVALALRFGRAIGAW